MIKQRPILEQGIDGEINFNSFSIQTMNSIAKTALSTQGYTGDGTTEINAYLNQADVRFNGVNDLERIYMQQYLNFFRNGNEALVLCRRTDFPKNGSTYYRRE